jgi:DNA-binding MarR family transcriptional regulator
MKPHISKSSRAAAQKAQSRRPVVKRSRPKAERARVPVAAAANQKHPTGKLGRVLNAVAATQGASLDELVELTGWQPHTARAALTRLRQRGFAVDLRETADRKAYHLAEAVSQ